MQTIQEKILVEYKLPDIIGDRCVHAHIETASCNACVTTCPENAWILDDESLGLNTEVCDGCGLCVPACTEGAILQSRICTIREETIDNNILRRVLLLGCEKTGLAEANCKCIHAVSSADLLKLNRDGIYQIQLSTGDCQACSRGEGESLFERIENINKMFKLRNLRPIAYNNLPPNHWQKLWKTPEKTAPGPEMSRRMFFHRALKQTVDMVMHQSSFGESEVFIPLGEILPTTQIDNPIYPAVPKINIAKCNGCDACMRACPHEVISFQNDEKSTAYKINASACTACKICEDICDQSAIEVDLWAQQDNDTVLLSAQKCPSCGVDFHYPQIEKQSEKSELCIICSKVNHRKNLFQVV